MTTPRRQTRTEATITVASRPITLRRPVRADFARRLADNHARLTALNTAGKSQRDAAEAMGISVPLLRTWLDVLNLKWSNIQPRAPYSLR
jgi:hypothetical protein